MPLPTFTFPGMQNVQVFATFTLGNLSDTLVGVSNAIRGTVRVVLSGAHFIALTERFVAFNYTSLTLVFADEPITRIWT